MNIGHGGRDRMLGAVDQYENIPSEVIKLFLGFCESCVLKKYVVHKGLVSQPIISHRFNEHVQVDLVDMQGQPCDEFRFFLVYQDHFTKLVQIWPLKRKTAKSVAAIIFNCISVFGVPQILQSDNGREFKNKVLEKLCELLKIKRVSGLPRHSQTNGGVERANQDIENMLVTWKADNPDLPWTTGLKFVQMYKNSALCAPLKMSPFEATFGCKMLNGLANTIIPQEIFAETNSESDLKKLNVLPDGDIVSINLLTITYKKIH